MGCIYRIINKIDSKSYIGQTIFDNPSKRWNTHKSNFKKEKHQEYLYRAIRKYGIENFEFSIICICKKEELSQLECNYIKEYNTFGNGYNMTSGGEGTRGYKASEETRKKISLAGKGRVPTEETRKKLSISNKGRKVSEETREKLRKASTGVIKKKETIEKLKIALSHRIIKDSTREKLRNNMIGKPKSPEHIANVKKAKRILSEEDVKYIRENPNKLQGKELALKFKSSRASISRIINNKRYI
jgi:group I intron endonuclease